MAAVMLAITATTTTKRPFQSAASNHFSRVLSMPVFNYLSNEREKVSS
jgi:hypothetical protein